MVWHTHRVAKLAWSAKFGNAGEICEGLSAQRQLGWREWPWRGLDHEYRIGMKPDVRLGLDRHRRWLRTVAAARSGEVAAADEILQEVGVAVVKAADVPETEDRIAPWLYRITVRQALLYRRGLGRRRRLERRFAAGVSPRDVSREPDPLDWLLADERRRLIREALERLSRKDAEILLLKYTEDVRQRELAERLGVSEGAVESRLHRARERLRRELATAGVVETMEVNS